MLLSNGVTDEKPINPKSPTVTQIPTSPALKTMNYIVGMALLVMLTPISGKLPEKPAGVRTAIEMVSKKPALRANAIGIATAA